MALAVAFATCWLSPPGPYAMCARQELEMTFERFQVGQSVPFTIHPYLNVIQFATKKGQVEDEPSGNLDFKFPSLKSPKLMILVLKGHPCS